MKTITLYQYLLSSARYAVSMQRPNGSFPPGHNGPYHDLETPVRNTSHWLFTFCKLLENENDPLLKESAHKAVDYLVSSEARPMGASFFCRRNPEKDFANGLMGQAWAFEGLIAAYRYLGRQDAYDVASEVFFLHPWVERQSIWRRVAVDGSYLSPDSTFNHQLWFAAIAAQLGDSEATRRARSFLDNVGQHVQTYRNGVIFHASRLGYFDWKHSGKPEILKHIYSIIFRASIYRQLYSKSVGYHSFNLYAFAMLKESFPQHAFWRESIFKRMLEVINTKKFSEDLEVSEYGWPYNPPGIEFSYACEVFEVGNDISQAWVDKQIKKTYCKQTGDLMTHEVPDVCTSSARIYEATRLLGNYRVSVPE